VKRWAWIAISLLSLGAVVWWASHQQAPRMPTSGAGASWLAVSLTVYGLALALRGWRWHRIMTLTEIPHSRADAFDLTLVAYMGNAVLPLRGGEVLRVALMDRRSPAGIGEIIGSVIADRLFDLTALAGIFAMLTWEGVAGAPAGKVAADIAAAGIVIAAAALAVCLALRRRGRFGAFADRVRPVVRASKLLAQPEGVPLLGTSVVIWLFEGLTLMFVGFALDLHLSLLEALLTAVIAALAASVPAGPGYAGSYDAGVLVALHASGITGGSAVGFLLLSRFVVFVPVTLVGIVLLGVRYGGLRLLPGRKRVSQRDQYGRTPMRSSLSVAGAASKDPRSDKTKR
jgi:glycosyltransferase 2 family protein